MLTYAVLAVIICLVGRGIYDSVRESRMEKRRIAEEERRLERFFRRSEKIWRLYLYARDKGIAFEIQPAEKAWPDFRGNIINWFTFYSIAIKKSLGHQPLEWEIVNPRIVVPLDILEIREEIEAEKFLFMSRRVEDLMSLGRDNLEFLKVIQPYLAKLQAEVTLAEEFIVKDVLCALAHEIGHQKLVRERLMDFEKRCPAADLEDFRGCLLEELFAGKKGLEILDELDLAEFVGKSYFLMEAKKTAMAQCRYCLSARNHARCLFGEELMETIHNFH